MNKHLLVYLCAGAVMLSSAAYAQRVDSLSGSSTALLSEGIAAIVNDVAISTGDVRDRLDLALLSSGLPNQPEVREKLLPQVLRGLIEEQLQLQEGKKLGLDVTDEEMRGALGKIAQDNQIPGGDMEAFLKAKGVSPAALRAQVKASLVWNKILMREIRPRIDIGEDEVKTAIQSLRENAGKQEYLVSEIFLAVEKPEEDAQVEAFARKLVEQIKAGALFGAVARQFSQGTGAGAGGDVGWIRSGELAAEVDSLLQSMKTQEIAGPVRSASGYHIIGLRDKRVVSLGDVKDMKAKMGQIFKPFSNEAEKEKLLMEARSVRAAVQGCAGIEDRLRDSFPGWSWQDMGEIELAKAPSWLTEKVAALGEGLASEPMANDKGILMLCLCSRDVPENVNQEAIRNAIGSEKMERMARGFLRDLRRDAYLDIRLKDVP